MKWAKILPDAGKGAFDQWVGNGGGVQQVEGRRGEGDDDFATCGILRQVEFRGGWDFAERLNSAEMDPARMGCGEAEEFVGLRIRQGIREFRTSEFGGEVEEGSVG